MKCTYATANYRTLTIEVDIVSKSAFEKEAKADQKQTDTVAAASQDVAAQTQRADAKSADAAYDVAVTRADGDYDITVAKCERLSGDAQKTCMDEAGAARDMTKAKAKAVQAEHI